MEKKQHSIWERDITHEIVGVLAVFGLTVSSLVAGLGVATLGVEAQLALAQYESVANQAAAVAEVAKRPGLPILKRVASSTPAEGSSALHNAATSSPTAVYCPRIVKAVALGGKDTDATGDVRELQRFIASRYGLDTKKAVTGYFGSTTAGYLERFQKEQGIPPSSNAGPLTRAAIARACLGGDRRVERSLGTTTNMTGDDRKLPQKDFIRPAPGTMIGTSTRPAPPPVSPAASSTRPRDLPSQPASPTAANPGVSIQTYEGASNAAAVVEALAQIGEGYQKLLRASLSLVGL